MDIKFKKVNKLAKMPTRGSKYSAGYDLYACTDKDIIIMSQETVKIDTGIAIELPNGTFGAIYARSGLATKRGLRPSNCVGICDSDYRGNYIVALHNDLDTAQCIQAGERIAQLIIQRFEEVNFVEVDELSDTERGEGGFGSTGTK